MSQNIDNGSRGASLRGALGRFATGVAVVTALDDRGQPLGMTVNSFNSVSLEPALVSWCIDRRAASFESFTRARGFTVTVLSEHQAGLARRFATRGANKFDGIETGPDEPPVIPGGCAWFKCIACASIPLGDHSMLIGQVVEHANLPLRPLVFEGGRLQRLAADAAMETRAAA